MAKEFDRFDVNAKFVLQGRDELRVVLQVEISVDYIQVSPVGDMVDFYVLQQSMNVEGVHRLFTCSHCGCCGCAGRWDGVQVSFDGDTIEWKDLDVDKHWVFQRDSIQESIDYVQKQIEDYKPLIDKAGLELEINFSFG